ncbi:MAG: hypothetical protein ACE14S_08020 [Candidatus Bathyarchaeia archaeon]
MDRYHSTVDPYSISDDTIENMSRMLTKEARQQLFEELCATVGKRIPERIWQETGIRKTDVYRYLPKRKSRRRGLVPSPTTTAKVVKALLKRRKYDAVAKIFEAAANEMHRSFQEFFEWRRWMRNSNVIDNPLSDSEWSKIRRSLP